MILGSENGGFPKRLQDPFGNGFHAAVAGMGDPGVACHLLCAVGGEIEMTLGGFVCLAATGAKIGLLDIVLLAELEQTGEEGGLVEPTVSPHHCGVRAM